MTYGLSHWLPYSGMGAVNDDPLSFRSGLAGAQSWVVPAVYSPAGVPASYWNTWTQQMQQVGSAKCPLRTYIHTDTEPVVTSS